MLSAIYGALAMMPITFGIARTRWCLAAEAAEHQHNAWANSPLAIDSPTRKHAYGFERTNHDPLGDDGDSVFGAGPCNAAVLRLQPVTFDGARGLRARVRCAGLDR